MKLPARWFAVGLIIGSVLAAGPHSVAAAAETAAEEATEAAKTPHIVFLAGDDEYRCEESMPMLARIIARDFGFKTTICYSLDEKGHIAPDNTKSISGLEALADAELMVLFLRFRELPDEQIQRFVDYVESGRPVVGFRPTIAGFRYRRGKYKPWNRRNIAKLLGQRWIAHHGKPWTEVKPIDDAKEHPILRGIKPFKCYSALYHVEGPRHKLHGDCRPLLTGTAVDSSRKAKQDIYPLTQPVAWTKTHTGKDGRKGRVFFTTLGHPFDFKEEQVRKLAINGILWALGREDAIPAAGAGTKLAGEYEPNDIGVGKKYKVGIKPEERNAGLK